MTRQDYILLAKTLKDTKAEHCSDAMSQWEADAQHIADALQSDNPRFNKEKFLAACQGE
jgi:hypothetical protein